MKIKIDKYKLILLIILICAILIRIYYIQNTPISIYQYDAGMYSSLNSEEDYDNLYSNFDEDYNEGRHINYIMYLYTYNSLPNTIIGQFYHPPLHHFIMSTWLKLMDFLSDVSSFKFESMQFVTLAYSIVILIAVYKILEELEIKDKYKILAMLMISFYPIYIFESGSINNDELVIMFSILCYLYLIKWQKNPNIKNTIIIALCIRFRIHDKNINVRDVSTNNLRLF